MAFNGSCFVEGKDNIGKLKTSPQVRRYGLSRPCLQYDYKKWQEISRPWFLPLVLNLSETVSFRWLKIRIIGHLISETINLLISETFK